MMLTIPQAVSAMCAEVLALLSLLVLLLFSLFLVFFVGNWYVILFWFVSHMHCFLWVLCCQTVSTTLRKWWYNFRILQSIFHISVKLVHTPALWLQNQSAVIWSAVLSIWKVPFKMESDSVYGHFVQTGKQTAIRLSLIFVYLVTYTIIWVKPALYFTL